jgi:hypothetical protein
MTRLLRKTRATEAAASLFLIRLVGRVGPCPLLIVAVILGVLQAQPPTTMEFEYTSIRGAQDLDVSLKVRNGVATLIRRPVRPRRDGALIGVFRAPANAAFLKWLEHGVPERLPESSGLRPDSEVISFTWRWGGKTISYGAGVPSNASEALAPLTAEVLKVIAELDASPLRTVGVESLGLEKDTWRVRLRNPGSLPVEIRWAEKPVHVSGYLDGASSGDRVELATDVAEHGAAVIAPNGTVDTAIPVRFPSPGVWNVRAVYEVQFGTQVDSGPIGGAAASKYVRVHVR